MTRGSRQNLPPRRVPPTSGTKRLSEPASLRHKGRRGGTATRTVLAMKQFDLTGRTAVVTGSSRGIGRAIAETLAGAGAKVVVSSRKAEACQAVVASIQNAGGTAIGMPCTVGH